MKRTKVFLSFLAITLSASISSAHTNLESSDEYDFHESEGIHPAIDIDEIINDIVDEDSDSADFAFLGLGGIEQAARNVGARVFIRGGTQDHAIGKAVDVMVYGNSGLGHRVLNNLLGQRGRLGVKYLIWQQKIYGSWTGWQGRWMENRGNATANHYDHVHVSIY